jgi:hypothetical protein
MKRWKIPIILVILIVSFFVPFVSSQSCGGDDTQLLFSISSNINAHGAVDDSYSVEVCFDERFDGEGTGSQDAAELILSLSGVTNAHAESPDKNTIGYVGVFYNDLNCELLDQEAGESDYCELYDDGSGRDSAFIVSLSSDTNAHLALGSQYDFHLCCIHDTINAKCDYDGECEDGQDGREDRGENNINCPHDCEDQITGGVCGDTSIDLGEECDPSASPSPFRVGEEDCTDIPGNLYQGGTLGCYPIGHPDKCMLDVTDCILVPGGGDVEFCELPPDGYAPFMYDDGGTLFPVTQCPQFELVDTPDDYDGSNFQRDACLSCWAGVATWDDPGGTFEGVRLQGLHCEWDGSTNNCDLVGETSFGNPPCITRQISAVGCDTLDDLKGTVTYTNNCEGCDSDNPCVEEYFCPVPVQFPFFGWINFVISLIAISFVYIFYLGRAKK